MAASKINMSIADLRTICLDSTASPQHRMRAASKLLKLGASERSVPVIRSVSKAFESHADSVIAVRAQRLAIRLERAIDESREAIESKRASSEMISHPIVGGLDLIPPDTNDDPWWDNETEGVSRRAQFAIVWSLQHGASRDEAVKEITADYDRLMANVARLATWASTRHQLDERFERDTAALKQCLAARGVDYCDEELARLEASLEPPLVEFVKQTDSDMPQLVLTAAGTLLDQIHFVKTWKSTRTNHEPI